MGFMIATRAYFRWIFLCICVGLIAGLTSSGFLISLNWVWTFQNAHRETIFLLPVIAVLLTYFFQKYASEFSDSNRLLFEEIHEPQRVLPILIAPFVFIGTLLSHFAGASTGREGAAVQISASMTDQLSKIFHIKATERKILLVAGSGAAFGAATGAPLAGIIFGMEMIFSGRLRIFALFECLLASYIAYSVGQFLRAPHYQFTGPGSIDYQPINFLWVMLAGVLFGLVARLFVWTHHHFQKLVQLLPLKVLMRNLLGGILLASFFYFEASYHYTSLGLNEIQHALSERVSLQMPVLKFLATILSIGSGLKGGEFVPLVFIGSHIGSAMSEYLPLAPGVLAALGFAAVFGGAAHVPITCAIMGCELFGWRLAPFAFISCLASYYVSGDKGIYLGQIKSSHPKHSAIVEWWHLIIKKISSGTGNRIQ